MAVIRHLRFWQIILIVAVLIAGVLGAYFLLNRGDSSTTGGLSENEQLVAIRRGDLVKQVQMGGTLTFPKKEALHIGSESIVKDVLVSVGQTVVEGQALITLNEATVSSLDEAVAKARSAVHNAERALATLLDDAEAGLSTAEEALAGAEMNVDKARKDRDSSVEMAEKTVMTAENTYGDVYTAWLGIQLTPAELELSPDQLITAWNIDLDAIFAPDDSLDIGRGIYARGAPSDDPATLWSEPIIYAVANFYPGKVTGTCASDEHPLHGFCVRKGMDDGWKELDTSRTALRTARLEGDAAVVKAEAELKTAQESVAAAQTGVEQATEGPGGFAYDLKRAELASAKLALDDVLKQRQETTLRTPIAGIVTTLNAKAGQTLPKDVTVAIEIIDTSAARLTGVVDETDVLKVNPGDPAEITLPALPDLTLTGMVSSIASAGESREGVTVYPLEIEIAKPPNVVLREGMSANARMAVEVEENVLLVPVQAIWGTFQEPVLRVMVEGRIENHPVTLGSTDDFLVVVTEGAEEGEEIIMVVQEAFENRFSEVTFG